MTTPARQAEADRVELAYHAALTILAARTIEESLSLWQDVPATQAAQGSATWLRSAVRLVSFRRAFATDLGLAYYRLVRALRTGATIADPRIEEDEFTSLDNLRDEFDDAIERIAPESPAEELPTDSPQEPSEAPQPTVPPQPDPIEGDDEDDRILVEEIERLEAEVDRLEREAEAEAARQLDLLGVEDMLKALEDIDDEEPAEDVDVQRELAHRQSGAKQAAAAARITMNASRGLVYNLGEYDGRVMAWARFSQTGTPCGWCAMLISRGATYKSAKSAQHQGKGQDEDKYHNNCYCIAIPVFTQDQYDGSHLFDLNREYHTLWQNGDKDNDLSANPSLPEWRAYFRRMQKQQEAQTQAAA